MKITKEMARKICTELNIKQPVMAPPGSNQFSLHFKAEEFNKKKGYKGKGPKKSKKLESDDEGNVVFRMLSNGTVTKQSFFGTIPYDFSEVEMNNETTIAMFSDVKLMKNHSRNIDDIIGKTGDAEFAVADGDTPSGINAPLIFHEKFGAIEKEKVESGLIDSGSVGIQFSTRPSHQFEDEDDFYWLLGKEVDGELVRFIVDSIDGIQEFSLVWQGADPHAKAQTEATATFEKEIKDLKVENNELKSQITKLEAGPPIQQEESGFEKDVKKVLSEEFKGRDFDGLVMLAKQALNYIDRERQATLDLMIKADMVNDGMKALINSTEDLTQLEGIKQLYQKEFDKLPNGRTSKVVDLDSDTQLVSMEEGVTVPFDGGFVSLNLQPVNKEG